MAVSPPFNQTAEEAAKHNWPAPENRYACSACSSCGNGYFGPKRSFVCHACYQKLTAPVSEFQDLSFKPAPEGPYVYEPTMQLPDKFVTPEPLPTPFERELLTILIEECAEVAQRATKMLRFGVMEVQEGQSLTNRDRLSDEVGDLQSMVDQLRSANLLVMPRVFRASENKRMKLLKYMQTEKDTPRE